MYIDKGDEIRNALIEFSNEFKGDGQSKIKDQDTGGRGLYLESCITNIYQYLKIYLRGYIYICIYIYTYMYICKCIYIYI
jgi:hypothetical protein